MSAKRSWDIKPNRRSAKKAEPKRRKVVRRRGQSLAARRGEKRKRTLLLVSIGAIVILLLTIYGLWRPEVRITEAEAVGIDAEPIKALMLEASTGSYAGIIPRNSVFFFPEQTVRKAILHAYPEFSAVAINRVGFNAISVRPIFRQHAFWWCGTPTFSPQGTDSCYNADSNGFIYSYAGTSEELGGEELRMYSSLIESDVTEEYPLRSELTQVSTIPSALRFVRALKTLKVGITRVALRDDEADLFLPNGTRITYVLGHEEEAITVMAATIPSLDLVGGQVEYIDARFDGKVYVKRKE